ncbi:MAG: T9SS type A sorting domain-containing protein, partial [Balneolales bacterium]|nr:T9SS type A sorting domain-containing protein [Balneolales bacterium]
CGRFDVVEKIVISPTTGSIFYGANLFGIYKSTNGLATQTHVLGERGDHFYADVEVNSNGVVIAVVSASFIAGPGLSDPGIYISSDDGENWTNITPNSFPVVPARSVIGIAPSNPNIFFVFNDETGNAEDLSLFRFDITNINDIQVSDRTPGIPNFGAYDDIPNKRVGDLDPQGGYNLMVKVHPTNPDAVFLGATNLFRSTDGFSTTPPVDGNGDTDPSVASTYWIGGYSTANNVSQYENHHADQHNLVFDPTNPNRAFSLHDGGISVTENILATPVVWSDIDDGYNVTQFYTVSIHPDENDPRVAGGTQDNGSPYFLFDVEDGPSNSVDPSSGDGAFNYVGDDIFLTSSQRGVLLSYEYSGFNVTEFSYVYPSNATNQLFIHPVAVNPSNESYVFYPENDHLWRNDQILSLPRNTNSEGTTQGWDELNNVSVDNTHQITALEFSTSNPGNRLYFGGSDGDLAPIIKRLDDINATDGEVDISIPLAAGGGYVHDIAVNPENGNELVVVLSNYNIESIWYSNNSGPSWTAIGGNLEGENGPSVRSAAFAPSSNGNYIFVGTSIGLFFTETPNEEHTQWTQAAENVIGNVVVADLDYRTTDDLLAVGTHGRGVFIGNIGITTSNEDDSGVPSGFVLQQNYPNPFNPGTSINFSLPVNSRVTLTVFDVAGREVARLLDNEILSSGSHDELFDASNLASGTYIYRLDAVPVSGGSVFSQTKTMTLIK